MSNWLERTELLVGAENIEKLKSANVLLVGLGGVGSYAGEFLCRAGIGRMTIIDGDIVDITNTNRQLPATHATVGQGKAELMGARMRDINPELELTVLKEFLQPERMAELVGGGNFDYVLDCIDSLQPKLQLIIACRESEVKIISSMGAGGRMDATRVRVVDINKSHTCPFAHHVRRGLKRLGYRNFKGMPVVFSDEPVAEHALRMTDGTNFKKSFYGTISYIPALFGLQMAGYVIQALVQKEVEKEPDEANKIS